MHLDISGCNYGKMLVRLADLLKSGHSLMAVHLTDNGLSYEQSLQIKNKFRVVDPTQDEDLQSPTSPAKRMKLGLGFGLGMQLRNRIMNSFTEDDYLIEQNEVKEVGNKSVLLDNNLQVLVEQLRRAK